MGVVLAVNVAVTVCGCVDVGLSVNVKAIYFLGNVKVAIPSAYTHTQASARTNLI